MKIFKLYNYQVLNSTYKLLKLRTPIAVYCVFMPKNIPTIGNSVIVPKEFSKRFICSANMLWNTFLTCNKGLLAKNRTAELGSLN